MVNPVLSIHEHNAQEIAKLRRWQLRTSIILFASIAWMLLTCVGSCVATGVINMYNFGLNYSYITMLCGVLLPVIGLAGVLLMRGDLARLHPPHLAQEDVLGLARLTLLLG